MIAKWGQKEDRPADPYHPLVCHMADVAAVALALWDRSLPEAARELLAEGLGFKGGPAGGEARLWVAFLAGLHDLGKASKPFQGRDPHHRERLAGTSLDARCRRDDPGHGSVTAVTLSRLLENRGIERKLACRLALLLGGHHGLFPRKLVADADAAFCEARDDAGGWPAVREELLEALASAVALPPTIPSGEMSNAAAMLFAGLVSVADWIGSIDSPGYFEYDPAGAADLSAYFAKVRRRADRVLGKLHWLGYPEPGNEQGFRALFGWEPRPLQRAAASIRERLSGGGIAVIEAPMGEGKTEAALHLIDSWNAGATGRGCYIGLPTQATATQMHQRVLSFLSGRFPAEQVNLVLAHGGAATMDLSVLPSGVYAEEDGAVSGNQHSRPGEGTVAAGEWFLQRKRALLAPYGVGTVDQSLLAVLQVKHVFVRLFGLAGKPVVIDEVHAYDTYMTGLLERLLEWLGALRSPVVLLSATLPTGRRRRLLAAYLRGRTNDEGIFAPEAHAAKYPRLTYLADEREVTTGFSAESNRELCIRRAPEDDEGLARYLAALLEDGGCAAVICNTVRRAQRTYEVLRDEMGLMPAQELGLFHARFRRKDRDVIEKECLRKFGKPDQGKDTTAARPGKYVLVATQVVEQSLDLDFDVMVSDLAPIDLLLQRAGRLQRHRRADRRGPGEDALHVRWPDDDEGGLPQFDPGSAAVYDEHILLRTWHALSERSEIRIPEDVQETIDRVYAEEDPDLHPQLQALTRLAAPSVRVVLLSAGAEPPAGAAGLRRDRVRELLDYEVSVPNRLAVAALSKEPPPPSFAATPALRRHRLLQLGADNTASLEGMVFTYSAELGLQVSGAGQGP